MNTNQRSRLRISDFELRIAGTCANCGALDMPERDCRGGDFGNPKSEIRNPKFRGA
jgi:hypothetical protein